jgi:hypothetical protein
MFKVQSALHLRVINIHCRKNYYYFSFLLIYLPPLDFDLCKWIISFRLSLKNYCLLFIIKFENALFKHSADNTVCRFDNSKKESLSKITTMCRKLSGIRRLLVTDYVGTLYTWPILNEHVRISELSESLLVVNVVLILCECFVFSGQALRNLLSVGGTAEKTSSVQAALIDLRQCETSSRSNSSRHEQTCQESLCA